MKFQNNREFANDIWLTLNNNEFFYQHYICPTGQGVWAWEHLADIAIFEYFAYVVGISEENAETMKAVLPRDLYEEVARLFEEGWREEEWDGD